MILSDTGRALVHEVTRRRRVEIASIMERVPVTQRRAIVEALTAFRDAAGEDDVVLTVPW